MTPVALAPPDPRFTIRPVRFVDCEPLRRTCWPQRDYEGVYRFVNRARVQAQQGRGLGAVVVVAGEAQAYGQFTMWPRCGEISDLIVAPPLRGQGIGTALIQYLTRAARDMHSACVDIGVARSNPRALALYQRLGFRETRTENLDLGQGPELVIYLRIKF